MVVIYAYIPRPDQVDAQISVPKGHVVAGFAIGILTLDTWYPLLPGNVANATTYTFPVLYKTLRGITHAAVARGDPKVLEPLVAGGEELEKQGVRAIIGACGNFANYQKDVAAALRIPVFLSSLLQIPIIKRGLKPTQKVGIIQMNASALTSRICTQCGIDDLSDIVIVGAGDLPECQNILNDTGQFNSFTLEKELVEVSRQFVSNNPDVGAILLSCSDIATYAWSIQNAVKLPVFDYTTLINWVYTGIVRYPFTGFI
jgi:hypothetical protein